jgi:hypothetical protein
VITGRIGLPKKAVEDKIANSEEARAVRGKGGCNKKKEDDTCCEQRLIIHLNNNIGFYNRAIWLLQDPVERRLLLEAALANHPDILDLVDDIPLAVSGNYVAFLYNKFPSSSSSESKEEEEAQKKPRVSMVSLPTRGLFAEAQLGHCNSCETRDVTRFWKWDESPCEKAPVIEGITPGPKGQPATVQPASLPAPVVQIMQPPSEPDPVGLAAALNLLGKPDIFRNMSGMAEVSKLLDGLVSGAVDLAKAQSMAAKAKDALRSETIKSNGASYGGRSVPSEPVAEKQIDKLNAIEYAKEKGLIDDTKGQNAAEGVLGGGRPLLASADAGFIPDIGLSAERPSVILIAAIAGDPRLQESYSQLVSDGWELRQTNIYFGNSYIDIDKKFLYIDDDIEPLGTQLQWTIDAVQKAYQEDDDYRLRAIRDKAISIFSTAGLTDLEKMANVYEWAIWFWQYPSSNGDATALLDDMMLVLTYLQSNGISNNDGTYYIFSRIPDAESIGFKYQYRDGTNQVRHATASIQASYKFGLYGLAYMQSREALNSADFRLNMKCSEIASNLNLVWKAKDIGTILRRELGDPTQNGPWPGPLDGDPNPP